MDQLISEFSDHRVPDIDEPRTEHWWTKNLKFWTGPGSAKNWDLKIVRDIKIRMSEIIGNDREYEKWSEIDPSGNDFH